ncbi:hexose transporter [Colletotrichum musicola]|uniref:Hexose transporter n=1 Tax=Colletotrichum musicola TaxID=2175873 RepID=A0A8H6K4A9_9PEZI|nr:hexose transporter [Colletotrichum musicola]
MASATFTESRMAPGVRDAFNECHEDKTSDSPHTLANGRLFNSSGVWWWQDAGLRSLNLRLLAVFISPLMIGYDGTLIGSLLTMPHWYQDLGVSPKDGSLIGLMGAGYSFGAMIAFPLSSWIADTCGRRVMIMLGDVIMIAAVIGQIFCFDARLYVLTRFILGIGSMFVIASCPVLLTELAHPRQRSFLVGGYASLFFVGSVIAAWVSFGSLHIRGQWSWRISTLLQLFPPVIQLPFILVVPESPRWLVSHNRHNEAKDILIKYHANSQPDDELVIVQYAEICQAIELDHQSQSASWMSWLRGPGNRRRLLLVVFCTIFGSWSGNGIITFYFSLALKQVGITEPAQQTGINGGLQIFNLLIALLGASLVDRLGRRVLFLSSGVIMLLAMVGFTVATEQFTQEARSASGKSLVAMVFLFQFGSDIGFTPLTPLYTAEICPYHLRAKAMALHYLLMYAFGAAGQYANPVALQTMGWRYYLVYVGILVFEVVFTYFLFPETKGHTIEEISYIFHE